MFWSIKNILDIEEMWEMWKWSSHVQMSDSRSLVKSLFIFIIL